jgi:hypothetical protein
MKCAAIIGTFFLRICVSSFIRTSSYKRMDDRGWLYFFFISPGNIFMTSGSCDEVAKDADKLTRTVADENLIYSLEDAFFLWLFSPCCQFYLGFFFAVHKEYEQYISLPVDCTPWTLHGHQSKMLPSNKI